MEHTRRRFLAATGGALALAGCQSGDGDGTNTDTPTPMETPTADDGGGGSPPTVQVREHAEYGNILVAANGMTLYMFDNDTQGAGSSACSGGCLEAWPALTANGEPTAGDGVGAQLSTFERSDTGETQVAANGWPLYFYASDQAPGDASGQGVGDVWWVLRPDGTPVRPDGGGSSATVGVREHPEFGEILVDSEGMTLYMFDNDSQGAGSSTCSGSCLEAWPPLTVDGEASAGDGVSASLSTFERGSGETQVAANGWPLYYYASDESPGDAAGQGVGDVWWVLGPDGVPIRSMATDTAESGVGGY